MKPVAPINWSGKDNIHQLHDIVYKILRGNVSFGLDAQNSTDKNVKGAWGSVAGSTLITTTAIPDTEFPVTHNLGYIPVAYDIKYRNKAAIIYDSGGTPWTTTTIFLKCNVATTNIRLFIH